MVYSKDYLKKRGSNWYYYRRVPKDLREQVRKEFITYSLKTDSYTKAKELAQVHNRGVETYWDNLRAHDNDAFENYKAAQEAAKLFGYRYQPAQELSEGSLKDLIRRTKDVSEDFEQDVKRTTLLGATDSPTVTMSEAQDQYFTLTKDKHLNKNEDQLKRWKNPVKKAVRNWIDLLGDKPLGEYVRNDALDFRQWWLDRVQDEGLTPNSANKDIGKLNQIWTTCNDKLQLGLNPIFSSLRLAEDQSEEVRHPFEPEFIKNKILNPETLDGLNFEARMCVYQMASTGCGLNELCGLLPEEIHLDDEIPHIELKFNNVRRLKNKHRTRVIPLAGSACGHTATS
jgi:hypothetical protein